MKIGENIRHLRFQRKISQVDLAKQIGCSQRLVSSWERERRMPTIKYIVRISDVFDVSLDVLLKGEVRLCKN